MLSFLWSADAPLSDLPSLFVLLFSLFRYSFFRPAALPYNHPPSLSLPDEMLITYRVGNSWTMDSICRHTTDGGLSSCSCPSVSSLALTGWQTSRTCNLRVPFEYSSAWVLALLSRCSRVSLAVCLSHSLSLCLSSDRCLSQLLRCRLGVRCLVSDLSAIGTHAFPFASFRASGHTWIRVAFTENFSLEICKVL